MKAIHKFAEKWCDKFRDQKINYIELVDHFMADDCAALGFEMDCGHAFEERYGNAVYNHEELDRIIDDVDDVALLGSAIYSRWRYFNHWANSGEDILMPKNRSWFILALSRLANITGENPFIFQGTLQKIRIVSNDICYGLCLGPDDEVEQHITINAEGRVWFSSYIYGEVPGKYKKADSRIFEIDQTTANEMFRAFSSYFGDEYDEVFATDIGDWMMELTNTDGKTYRFRGSLCADFNFEGNDLSDLVREGLGMNDLYVFDGNRKPDVIERICIDYHRETKIVPKELPEGVAWDHVTWDYTEKLIIDRKSETLEHIQNIGTGCRVSRKYEVEEGVESLLDDLDADGFLCHVRGNPDDVIETPDEMKDYTITIDFKKSPQRIISGSFDKYGLPEDFPKFAEIIFDFMRFYGMGEILDPSVYGKAKRRNAEYIYCSVVFEDGGKSYCYIADDDSIEVGDFVIVPAGKDSHNAIVEVVDIDYFLEEDAPFPVEKTKHIIRKCTDNDFEPLVQMEKENMHERMEPDVE